MKNLAARVLGFAFVAAFGVAVPSCSPGEPETLAMPQKTLTAADKVARQRREFGYPEKIPAIRGRVVAAGGAPVAHRRVAIVKAPAIADADHTYLIDEGAFTIVESTTTTQNGKFEFTTEAENPFWIGILPPKQPNDSTGDDLVCVARRTWILSVEDANDLVIHADAGEPIQGRVVDAAGKPLAGQIVRARMTNILPVGSAITDATGHFALGPVLPETFVIVGETRDLQRTTDEITVSVPGPEAVLTARAACELRIAVTDWPDSSDSRAEARIDLRGNPFWGSSKMITAHELAWPIASPGNYDIAIVTEDKSLIGIMRYPFSNDMKSAQITIPMRKAAQLKVRSAKTSGDEIYIVWVGECMLNVGQLAPKGEAFVVVPEGDVRVETLNCGTKSIHVSASKEAEVAIE